MLTKDLLKYSIRADRIYPKYVKPTEASLQSLAVELESRFQQRIGKRYRELAEELKQHPKAHDLVFQGLCKLIEDRCEFLDADESLGAQRWTWMLEAQKLRQKDFPSFQSFQHALAESLGQKFSLVEDALYGDLAEYRSLKEFKPLGGEGLLHRYNLSQIQGLLLRAQNVTVKIKCSDVLQRRRLLQRLRFCRLLAEFTEEPEKGTLALKISGPLALFEAAQGYGVRLCHFFPYVLLFDNWELEAEVRLGEKRLMLQVDSSKPIRSHYQGFAGYIPEELREFINRFNQLETEQRGGWRVEEGRESLNLGQQSYCVPDFTFLHEKGAVHHLELFHRWHKGELMGRLASLHGAGGQFPLGLGVAKELLKDKSLEERLALVQQGQVSTFTFAQFPTVKAILTYLAKIKV